MCLSECCICGRESIFMRERTNFNKILLSMIKRAIKVEVYVKVNILKTEGRGF